MNSEINSIYELGALAAVESLRAAIDCQPAELVDKTTVLELLDAYIELKKRAAA